MDFQNSRNRLCGGGDAVRFFSSGESLDSLVYIDKL